MANDQLITSDETDYFLEYLLRCALTAPGAQTSPTAGRILARLLVVGAVEGGDELITPYLVPVPGRDATFEVRSYQPGDLVPTDVRDGLRAAAALKIALRSARDSDDGIEVVSRTESGVERCVLVRDSTGDFEFRFAGPETLIGNPAECSAARNAWETTLSTWRTLAPQATGEQASVTPGAPPGEPEPSATVPPAVSAPARSEPAPPAPKPAPAHSALAAAMADPAPGGSDPPLPPTAEVQQPDSAPPSAELAPEVRPPQPADDHSEGQSPAVTDDGSTGEAAPPAHPVAAEATAWPLSEAPDDPLRSALREAIANLVVEVDLSQVEQLLRRVLEDDRRDLVEPLARRLSARLAESRDRPDTQAIIDALTPILPKPAQLADAVAANVGALLSETVLRRRAGDSAVGTDGINLMIGIEQLQVRLDGMHDQLQKSAGLLQEMGDHLEAGDRRAAVAERISTSVDEEMQRLARRIDEQVSSLTESAAGGSELADGVARLTRKLRQSVAQFDRVLARMDEMLESDGGEQVRQLALAPTPAALPPASPAQERPWASHTVHPPGPLGPAARH